jgi:hypothetical protein
MFKKLLKRVGLENLINYDDDQRKSNLKKWKRKTDTDFKPKRRDRLRNHAEPHKPAHVQLDNEHNPNDWTY